MEDGSYKPYCKPNNIPIYVHAKSNHPPSVTKNIPVNINRRLSNISSSKDIFDSNIGIYQKAIRDCGYDFTLEYRPEVEEDGEEKVKKRRRKREVIWYNPPYNATVSTNIGKEYLKIVDECFPQGSKLRKIFNRNNMKISYSGTPNIAKIINAKNSRNIEKDEKITEKSCSCPKNGVCPLGKKCLFKNIIYNATITSGGKDSNYVGMCSTDFKSRLGVHKQSFKNPNTNQTSLSKHVHRLKNENKDFGIKWKLIDRGKIFSPISGICSLCIKEAYYIIFNENGKLLNSSNEIFSSCRHRKAALLCNRTKKSQGN